MDNNEEIKDEEIEVVVEKEEPTVEKVEHKKEECACHTKVIPDDAEVIDWTEPTEGEPEEIVDTTTESTTETADSTADTTEVTQ